MVASYKKLFKLLIDREMKNKELAAFVPFQQAKRKTELEYDKFNKAQKINSDFDKLIATTKKEMNEFKGSVPHLKVANMLNVHINLPPIEVQERIIKVLDNFNAICSDLGI